MTTLLAILACILTAAVALLVWALVARAKATPADDERLKERFRAAAAEALSANQTLLMEQARVVVENAQKISAAEFQKEGVALRGALDPFRENLNKLEVALQTMEKSRVGAYEGLSEKLKSLVESENLLRTQTGNLVSALSNTNARGAWGEMQLRRAVEFAGMLEKVDFDVQVVGSNTSGEPLRADMVVHLPSGRSVVVDSKVPMDAFLKAAQSSDPAERTRLWADHARALKSHAAKLGAKKYFEAFSPSPEFVVLFLNIESSLKAALDAEPTLLEESLAQKVIIATPTTLLALLKTVQLAWGETKAQDEAKAMLALMRELSERMEKVFGYWEDVGKTLNKSVEAYNAAQSSIENRLAPTLRKLDAQKDWSLPAVNSRTETH